MHPSLSPAGHWSWKWAIAPCRQTKNDCEPGVRLRSLSLLPKADMKTIFRCKHLSEPLFFLCGVSFINFRFNPKYTPQKTVNLPDMDNPSFLSTKSGETQFPASHDPHELALVCVLHCIPT